MTGVAGPGGDHHRVFALPPGADFAAELVRGLRARLDPDDPLAAARVRVFVNTERTRRRLRDIFLSGPVGVMPQIAVLTDLAKAPGLPMPTPPLRRRLELAQLVRKLLHEQPRLGQTAAALDLAEGLRSLLAEMQTEGLRFEVFDRIDPGELTRQWQLTLTFLELIRDVLEAEDRSAPDPEAALRRAMVAQALAWQTAPPSDPVIVAGSTGSRGATAIFLEAVARLPRGIVVLPALDAALPKQVWDGLPDMPEAADHPQYGLAVLSRQIGFDPGAVPMWTPGAAPNPARNRLISLALRPAPVTDQWLTDGPKLVPDLDAAIRGLSLVEAPDPPAEAAAIAVRMREALEEGQTVALISPDRVLARRVTANLARWGVTPDDSAGRPLSLTPPGVFLRLVAALGADAIPPSDLLGLLKHPLCASGWGRREHLRHVARLEVDLLRGGPPFIEHQTLAAWSAGLRDAPRDWQDWAAWLATALRTGPPAGDAPLATFLAWHRDLAEHLARGPDGRETGELWAEQAGERALAVLTALEEEAAASGDIDLPAYRTWIRLLLSEADVPDAPFAPHPDLAIWGTLEARTQSADVIILGGLNEGTWPRLPAPGYWLSRAMRATVGLPLPERRIGLSAHDFQHAAGAGTVVLTRSTQDGEAPTIPARWILRLTNLLGGLGADGAAALDRMRAGGTRLLDLAARLDPPDPGAKPARRPAPVPPQTARPGELPVTQVERLIRDPYAVYARYVLGLRKLDPVRSGADHLLRGESYHAVLERFVDRTRGHLPEDAAELFAAVTAEVLGERAPWPATRTLWTARLAAFAEDFLPAERLRRQSARPLALEVRGAVDVPDLPRAFRLTARADRIDLAENGHLRIYDYKGSPDSAKTALMFSRQLPLEAEIAKRGGFGGVPAVTADHLELIGTGTAARSVVLDLADPKLLHVWDEFLTLMSHYLCDGTAFPALTRPQLTTYAGDYDHLARRGEWVDGAEFEPEPVG